MSAEQAAAKRATNIYISANLVSRAKAMTPSLSHTIEALLEGWVAEEEARQSDRAAQVARWVAATNAVLEHGGSPDEWSQF